MYAYNRSNVAYDLSQFETDERVERRLKQSSRSHLKVHKTSVSKSGNWLKTVIVVAAAAMGAFALITSKAQLSEVNTMINRTSAQLEEAQSEHIRLQAQLDNMVTLSKVDEIATTQLGLQKTSKNQVKYISVHDRTMVQAAEREENIFATLKGWVDSSMEYLGF